MAHGDNALLDETEAEVAEHPTSPSLLHRLKEPRNALISLMAVALVAALAVLGFQMLLVILIMAGILGMVVAPTLIQIIGTLILTVALSVLFWFMVKAMARIQMPERPGSR